MISNSYFMVLDIETSTLFNNDNEPTAVWLSYGYCILYDKKANEKEVCYFREWKTLKSFFDKISFTFFGKKILCFVHNLGYEFDFLIKNVSPVESFLTNSTHSVISAKLTAYPEIEFRCSYKLTGISLRKLGSMIGIDKLDSDYRFILPKDSITDDEKYYCKRDCDVVAIYISKFLLKEYGKFIDCPLTKTGRVRITYKKYYEEYAKNHNIEWDYYPDEDCYNALNDAFSGGISTSNPLFTGMIIKNVDSYDITSSYPFAQLSEEFPYTIKRKYNFTKKDINNKFWIAKIKFNNITSKYNWGWLSISKMNDYDALSTVFFNGKLIQSNYIIRTITNVDYLSILDTYNFDDIEILEFYEMSKYGEMPKPYIDTIKIYAEKKHILKEKLHNMDENSDEYLDTYKEYMDAKGDFNSIYGMCVQKIIREEYTIDENFEWHIKKTQYTKPDKKHMKRSFLFGVYITAYARRNLLKAIVTNCPYTFIYCDTDSIKYIKQKEFIDTNKEHKYIDFPYLAKIGRFDYEGQYSKFITYGAKKYCVEKEGATKTIVAGLPKFDKTGHTEIIYNNEKINFNSVYCFRLNTIFSKCKLGKKYITDKLTCDADNPEFIYNIKHTDEYTKNFLIQNDIDTNGGVALYETDYKLDMTPNDIDYIKSNKKLFILWYKKLNIENYIEYDMIGA